MYTSTNQVPKPGGGPRSLADKINPELPSIFGGNFLGKNIKGWRFGWVLMDFADEEMCRMIIDTNKGANEYNWETSIEFKWQKSETHEFNIEEEWRNEHIKLMLDNKDLRKDYSAIFEKHFKVEFVDRDGDDKPDTIVCKNKYGLYDYIREFGGAKPHRPVFVYDTVDPQYTANLTEHKYVDSKFMQYDHKKIQLSFVTEPVHFNVRFDDNNNKDGQRPKSTYDLMKLAKISGILLTGNVADKPYRFEVNHTKEEAIIESAKINNNVPYLEYQEFADGEDSYSCTVYNLPAVNENAVAFSIRRMTDMVASSKLPYTVHIETDENNVFTAVLKKEKENKVEALINWIDGDNVHNDPTKDELDIVLQRFENGKWVEVSDLYQDRLTCESTGNRNQYKLVYHNLPPVEANRYSLDIFCGLDDLVSTFVSHKTTDMGDEVIHQYVYNVKKFDKFPTRRFMIKWEDEDYVNERGIHYDRPASMRDLTSQMHLLLNRTDYNGANPYVYTIIDGKGGNSGTKPDVEDTYLRTAGKETQLVIRNLPEIDAKAYKFKYELGGFEIEPDTVPYTYKVVEDEGTKVIVMTHKSTLSDLSATITFVDGSDSYGKRAEALSYLNDNNVWLRSFMNETDSYLSKNIKFSDSGTFTEQVPDSAHGKMITYKVEYPEVIPNYTLVSTDGINATYKMNDEVELQVKLIFDDEHNKDGIRPTGDDSSACNRIVQILGGPNGFINVQVPVTGEDVWVSDPVDAKAFEGDTTYEYSLGSFGRADGYDVSTWTESESESGQKPKKTFVIKYTRNNEEFTAITGTVTWVEYDNITHNNGNELSLNVLKNAYAHDTGDVPVWTDNVYTIGKDNKDNYPIAEYDDGIFVRFNDYSIRVTNHPSNYAVYEKGLDIMMVYNNVTVKGQIKWIGDTISTASEPSVVLYRNGLPCQDPVSSTASKETGVYNYVIKGLPYADESGDPYDYQIRVTLGEQDEFVDITNNESEWVKESDVSYISADATIKQKPIVSNAEITVSANIEGPYPGAKYPTDKKFTVCLDGATDADDNLHLEGVFNDTNNYRYTFSITEGMLEANKEYSFVLSQRQDGDSHWTIDSRRFVVKVKPVYLSGMNVEYIIDIQNPGIFVNHYTTTPVDVTLSVKNNVVVNVPDGFTVPNQTFTYELTKKVADGTTYLVDSKSVKYPYTITDANPNPDTIAFNSLRFMKPGEYTYTITQKAADSHGWVFDDTATRNITITVSDNNNDGNLEAEVRSELSEYTSSELSEYTNYYSVVGIALPFTKVLVSPDMDTETFSFVAFEYSSLGLTLEKDVKATDFVDNEFTTSFDQVFFYKEGEYSFIISEEAGENGYWKYDGVHYIRPIEVVRNSETKALTASFDDSIPVFVNEFMSSTVEAEVVFNDSGYEFRRPETVSIKIMKDKEESSVYTGLDLDLLKEEDYKGTTNPLPYYENDFEHEIISYNIEAPSINGYRNPSVTKTGDKYVVTYNAIPVDPVKPDPEPDPVKPRRNGKSYRSVLANVTAYVELENGTLKDRMFEFELRPLNEKMPMPLIMNEEGEMVEAEVVKARNKADGSIVFDTIIFTAPGLYKYKVNQLIGSVENCYFDEDVKTIVIEVSEEGNYGTLVAKPLSKEKFLNVIVVPEELVEPVIDDKPVIEDDKNNFPLFVIILAIIALLASVLYAVLRKKKCPNCGKTVDKDAEVCSHCGYDLSDKE